MTKILHSLRRGRVTSLAITLVAAWATGGLVACSDNPATELTAPTAAASRSTAPGQLKRVTGQKGSKGTTVGDTTVTQFVLLPGTQDTTISLGNQSKIFFPNGAQSVCDPATSGYGAALWDAPCTPLNQPITITAKSWVNPTTGAVGTDFSPELRFVPGQQYGVIIFLPESAGWSDDRIDWCSDGVCVDDGSIDGLLATKHHGDGYVYRIIKHFSGYNVVVN